MTAGKKGGFGGLTPLPIPDTKELFQDPHSC